MASSSSSEPIVDDDEQVVNETEEKVKIESPPPAKRRRGRRSAPAGTPTKRTARRAPVKGKGRATRKTKAVEQKAKKVEENEDSSLSAVFDKIEERGADVQPPASPKEIESSSSAAMKDDEDEEQAVSLSQPSAVVSSKPSMFREIRNPDDFLANGSSSGGRRPLTFVVWESPKKSAGYNSGQAASLIFKSLARTDASVVRCAPDRNSIRRICPTFDQGTLAAFNLHCKGPRIVAVNYNNKPFKVYACSQAITAVHTSEARRLGSPYNVYFYESIRDRAPKIFVCATSYSMANDILGEFVREKFDSDAKWSNFYIEAEQFDDKTVKTNYVVAQ
jgi:hypothetical protein